jgi:hypothetical protein
MSAPVDCGTEIVRGQDSYECGRLGVESCSDCGTSLCDLHAGACEFCLRVFCDCCLYFHAKDPHVKKPWPGTMMPQRRSA